MNAPIGDPETWNAGDYHHWERPVSPPCPHCQCCSEQLCSRAVAKDSACHWVGTSSDFDLSACPCWRDDTAEYAAIAAADLTEETGT